MYRIADHPKRHILYMLAATTMLGFLLRFGIAWFTVGTNDVVTWYYFGTNIQTHGLLATYDHYLAANHPPIPLYYAYLTQWMSIQWGARFEFILRLPGLIADIGSCLLIGHIFCQRRGLLIGFAASALYAWCLDAILISSYHGNTDSLYVFLAMLAVYFVDKRCFFYAGLALAAAINIKLIPVLIIPVLVVFCRTRHDFLRLMAGLGIGVIPFLPLILGAPELLIRNLLSYNSSVTTWGINLLINMSMGLPNHSLPQSIYGELYYYSGSRLILFFTGILCVCAKFRRRWSPYELAALVMALFLILAPGFAVQYTVAVLPFLFIASLRLGVVYGILAGYYVGSLYWMFIDPRYYRKFSYLWGSTPLPYHGLSVWIFLVFCFVLIFWRKNTATGTDLAFSSPASLEKEKKSCLSVI